MLNNGKNFIKYLVFMNMKKKNVLILGGSSDIGIEVIKIFLKLNWNVSAHYFKNKTKLNLLKKKSKNLIL